MMKVSAFGLLLSVFALNVAAAPKANSSSETTIQQQSLSIRGVVTDDSNEAVIGAGIVIAGTTVGTITDLDGAFTLDNVPADATLEITCVGYRTSTVSVDGKTVFDITLYEDSELLDEVVVVGYGVMRKSDVTGSIGTAKGSELTKAQNFSALDNLRGKVSGVNIFSNSSQPGAYSSRVVIRGQATINATSNPLYVVDGVVMEDFNLVNPNDIESMEVLKDASSAAIYGARGANGVIMVTTKRGKKGEPGTTVTYSGSVSVSSVARYMDTLNSQQWVDAFMIGLANENQYQGYNWSLNKTDWFNDSRYFDSSGNPIYDTNWQKEATRVAVSHNHQLSIQQANKNSSFGAFLNFTDQEGIVRNTDSKRVNAKMAYDANPTKWLSTSVNMLVNHTWGRWTPETGGDQSARRTMIEMLPFLPLKNSDGTYTTAADAMDGFGFEGMSNPVMILELQRRMNYNTQIFGNAALTFHIIDGLDLKTQFGVDYHHVAFRGYSSVTLNNISQPNGWAEYDTEDIFYWQEETYLTYNKVINKNRINAMAGLSWQARQYNYNYSHTEGFSDDFYEDYNMGVATIPSSPSSSWNRWAMNSYFLRLAYTYDDRYSATVTGRVDGSSKFGANHKYSFFPSAGLAWNAGNEAFLRNNRTISNLKVHTSYGLTGNSEIGVYNSLGTVSSGTLLQNGERVSYSYIGSIGNEDLKWEKTAQYDVGFELGLFHDRLSFDASYYYKKTTDLLLDCPVPHVTGFTSVYKNIGSVQNQGMDLMITGRPVDKKNFVWTSTLNLNFNKNKILALGENNEDIELNDFVSGANSILRVGEDMSSFFGYERYGVWTVEDYQHGECELSDIGRAHRSDEKVITGKGMPDWTGSWINNFSFYNFDVLIDFQFVWGVQTLQQFHHSTYDRFGITNGLTKILTDAYDGSNPGTMQQAIYLCGTGHAGQDTLPDSSWVADGSYLRLNMVQIGYNFDTSKWRTVHGLRLYLSGNNLFLITSKDFDGYDPESTSQGDSNMFGQNVTFFSYPRARTFTLGVDITF